MAHYTRRNILQALGAVTLVTASSGITSLAFAGARDISKETRCTMDTLVTIEVRHSSYDLRMQGIEQAFQAIADALPLFDRYNTNSAITLLNTTGKITSPPQELTSLLRFSKQLAYETRNVFNPTVQPLVDYFLQEKEHTKAGYSKARSLVHTMDAVTISDSAISFQHQDMGITLDGIAKGYIIDIAGNALTTLGIEHYMINAGGDIVVKGEPSEGNAWTIGIQSPLHKGRNIHTVALRNGAIATSGGYERYNKNHTQYTHLVNPHTGQSPQRIRSVSVVAPHAVLADALATSLSIMQPQYALRFIAQYPNTACYIVTDTDVLTSTLWHRLTV